MCPDTWAVTRNSWLHVHHCRSQLAPCREDDAVGRALAEGGGRPGFEFPPLPQMPCVLGQLTECLGLSSLSAPWRSQPCPATGVVRG